MMFPRKGEKNWHEICYEKSNLLFQVSSAVKVCDDVNRIALSPKKFWQCFHRSKKDSGLFHKKILKVTGNLVVVIII